MRAIVIIGSVSMRPCVWCLAIAAASCSYPALPRVAGDAGGPADAPADNAMDASSCPDGYADCNGTCLYLATDPNHCGSCTRFCPSGVCSVGRCLEYFGQRSGAN